MKKSLSLLFLTLILILGNSLSTLQAQQAISLKESEKIAKMDHAVWNKLLLKHVSTSGKVDYKGFQKSMSHLEVYFNQLSKNTPQDTWSKNEIIAYWINVYNAFTIKLILDNYPTKSIQALNNPWEIEFITLGNKKYSLNEIERKMLRKWNEPRILFAINRACLSSPILFHKAYTAQDLDNQLDNATKTFINDNTKNTISVDHIEIATIFKGFKSDYKLKESLIDFLNQYSLVKINKKATIKYTEYNWNLNE